MTFPYPSRPAALRLLSLLPFSLAILALPFTGGCTHSKAVNAPAAEAPSEIPVVAVSNARSEVWGQTVHVHGTLLPDESAVLGAKVAGRIAQMEVDVGSVVRKLQPVARLDDVQLELQVRHAEALLAQACAAIGIRPEDPTSQVVPENSPAVRQEQAVVDQARIAFDRAQLLRRQSVTTQEELDQREADYKVAVARHAASLNAVAEKIALIEVRRSEVILAQNAVEESTIVAPFDGIIQERMTAAGAYVNAGDSVASIVRTDKLRFLGSVPEKDAHLIRIGQQVLITVGNESEPRTAEISRLRPLIDSKSRALLFEADIANPDLELQPGLFAEAEVVVDPNAEAIVVPESAVVEFAGVEKVWRVVDGEAKEAIVSTGMRRQGFTVVLSGINAGDTIITDGAQARAGKVRIETTPTSL